MTECNQSTFEFAAHFSRQVVARFDGGTITTDGGGLLLRETDGRLNLLPRFAECFLDARNPLFVEHSVQELVSQRVYGLALGYEDLNDHEQLRNDPLLRVLADRGVAPQARATESDLSHSSRWKKRPSCARRCSHSREIQRIVAQVRAAWPEVKIILRGDSGFCRNELMNWSEENRVHYVFGLALNQRLRRIIGPQMWEATEQWDKTGKPARVFSEFAYKTKKRKKGGWDRERRVVGVSSETMRANQLRLYLSSMAYVLVCG